MGRHPSRRHITPDEAPIGRRIRQRRRELGLTQSKLAGPEYTKSFISQLEGGFADPSLDTLRFLSRRLQTSLSAIAGEAADQRLAAVEGLLRWGRELKAARRGTVARRVLQVASEIAGLAGWTLHRADALLLLAELDIEGGDATRAAALIEEASPLLDALGPRGLARRDVSAGWLALRLGDDAGAEAAFRNALAHLGTTARHPDLAVRALLGLAAALDRRGDHKQVRRRLQSAVKLAGRYRLSALHGRVLLALGFLSRQEGADQEALRHVRGASHALEGTDDRRGQIEAGLALGRLLLEQGAAAEAAETLRRAVDLTREGGDASGELEGLILLGRALLAAGDGPGALEAAQRVPTPADGLGDAAAHARASGLMGRALLRQGEAQEAVPLLVGAVEQLASGGPADELAEAAEDLGQYYRSSGQEDLAARYLSMAADVRRGARAREAWAMPLIA